MKTMHKLVALLLALLCTVAMTTLAGAEDLLSLSDIQDRTYAKNILENHTTAHQSMVYYGIQMGDETIDATFDYYYVNTDDGLVLYNEDSLGLKQMVRKDMVIRKAGDSEAEMLGFIDDSAFETVYLPMVEGPLYQQDAPSERLVNKREIGSQVYITVENDVAQSIRKPVFENLWGITDGKVVFEIVFDKASGDFLYSSTSHLSVNGELKLLVEAPIVYDVQYVIPEFIKTAIAEAETRTVHVVVNPGSDDSKEYTYQVPVGLHFTLYTQSPHTLYTDEAMTQVYEGHDGELPMECTVYAKVEG